MPKHSTLSSSGNAVQTRRRQKTVIKKERFLEKWIKEIEAEIERLETSRKNIHEIHRADLKNVFYKARCWRADEIENDLLQ